jgi:hypothetical protein
VVQERRFAQERESETERDLPSLGDCAPREEESSDGIPFLARGLRPLRTLCMTKTHTPA